MKQAIELFDTTPFLRADPASLRIGRRREVTAIKPGAWVALMDLQTTMQKAKRRPRARVMAGRAN